MSAPFEHSLLDLPKFGDGVGLHRVAFLMRRLGLEPAAMGARSVAVTGSNGKGSTAMIASALLAADGSRVGLFTSPHLFRFNERFRVDGEPVGDDDLAAAMDAVAGAVAAYGEEAGDAVGAFEAQFVTALLLFQRAGVRWQVLEAGIGGRYDPVRMARAPVAGLVSLDLEHTALLGSTLAQIAYDKLDAAPPGAVVVLGESCAPLRREIETFAGLAARQTAFVGPGDWRDRGVLDGRQRFDLILPDLMLEDAVSRLIGRHQLNNHAVAARLVLERWRRSGLAPPSGLAERWRRAISGVTWPGRLERVIEAPPVYVDVGHTPEGIRAALAAYVQVQAPERSILVLGGSRDKAVDEMVAILAPRFGRIVCAAAHHKGLDAAAVKALILEANPNARVTAAGSIAEAADLVLGEARREGMAVYAAGGLFLAIEFAAAVRGLNPTSLRFF